jgi:hypothetical protein
MHKNKLQKQMPGSASNAFHYIMLILVFATTLTIFFFDSALKVVDEALGAAAEVKRKTSKTADWAFKRAIDELARYEMECHTSQRRRIVNVKERMAAAKAKDITFSSVWDFLKNMFSPKVRLGRIQLFHLINNCFQATDNKHPEPTKVVEFLLLRSLPDPRPIVVKREHKIRSQFLIL